MSAFSTIRISREKARRELVTWVMSASDEELKVLMDQLLERRLYNVMICDQCDPNEDDIL